MGEGPRPLAEEALLLVDGEVIARHILVEYLQHCGYSVIAPVLTEEALTVADLSVYRLGRAVRAPGGRLPKRLCSRPLGAG